MTKKILIDIAISLVISIVLLALPFMLPYFIGSELMRVLFWPIENFVADRKAQHDLTLLIFGRLTPNYAPISLVLYLTFWPPIFFIILRLFRWFK